MVFLPKNGGFCGLAATLRPLDFSFLAPQQKIAATQLA
jgi:hypothetical protein